MENIEVLDFMEFYILVSKANGNVVSISKDVFEDIDVLNQILNDYEFFYRHKISKRL